MDITKLYQTQVSLTEWYEELGHKDTQKIKIEDNTKRDRLAILHKYTNLPYDKPAKFLARSIAHRDETFLNYLEDHANDLCALRLLPQKSDLPKLRMRGHTLLKSLDWFDIQTIEPNDYMVEVVPHSDQPIFGTIFVVNSSGIFGEIIRGGHHQLTQGFYEKNRPIRFSFDFETWWLSDIKDIEILEHLKQVVSKISIEDKEIQNILSNKLDAAFARDYLKGYFETTSSKEYPLFFIDYNRILGNLYKDFILKQEIFCEKSSLHGQIAYPGEVYGKAVTITKTNIAEYQFEKNSILICKMTSPLFIPLMKNAIGIATELGGLLSHAAIVSRELKVPCVVGIENLISSICTGDSVCLNANNGTITKIPS